MKICYHQFFLIKTAYQRAEAVQLKHCTTALKSKINNNKKKTKPLCGFNFEIAHKVTKQSGQYKQKKKPKTINLKFKNTYQSVY